MDIYMRDIQIIPCSNNSLIVKINLVQIFHTTKFKIINKWRRLEVLYL